jgi:Carboxypeptidase regulatory-like domain
VIATASSVACSSSPSTPTAALASPSTFYSISGVVHDDAGLPVADARLSIGGPGVKTGPALDTRTLADGTFRGRVSPSTGYEIIITKPGYLQILQFPVTVSADTVYDFTMHVGVVLIGVVTEVGVGGLAGATVEIASGPDAGDSTTTGPPGVEGSFRLQTLPGTFTVRAKKSGYDTVEQTITTLTDVSMNFQMHWSYGSCLQSVSPVLFDAYAATGGVETISVGAAAGRAWTAVADSPWIAIERTAQNGPGDVRFRVAPYPIGATQRRKGAVMIRCSASEGQNVWVNQIPNCQVQLTPIDVPAPFPAEGGIGRVAIHTGVPNCQWESRTDADWLRTTGVQSWPGDFSEGAFFVTPNTTGRARTAHFIVGDAAITVNQQ